MNRTNRILLCFLYPYAALALLTSIFWPMGRDQGIFAWVGDVINKGGTPYINAWEQKGPGAHYTFAISQYLFGNAQWGIRVLDAALLLIALAATWSIVRRTINKTFAHFATLLLLFQYFGLGFWHTAQPDGWASMLIIIAFAALLYKRNAWLLISVGLLLGLATSYKFLYAAFILPCAYLIWASDDNASSREKLFSIFVVLGGFTVTTAVILAWLNYHHALGEYWNIQFGFNRTNHQHANGHSLIERLGPLICFILRFGIGVPFLLWGLVSALLGNPQNKAASKAFLFSGLVGAGIVLLQNKYFPYHWMPVFFPLIFFTILGVHSFSVILSNNFRGDSRMAFIAESWISLALLVIMLDKANLAGHQYIESIPQVFKTLAQRDFSDARFLQTGDYCCGDFSFQAEYRVSKYIHDKTAPADYVLVWTFDPLINYLSNRESPSRFALNYPLIANTNSETCKSYRREFMDAIMRNPPLYIVTSDADKNSLMQETSKQYLLHFIELNSIFSKQFELETVIDKFEIWRRKAASSL